MDIKIIKEIDESYIDESLTQWKLATRNNLRQIRIFSVLIVFFISIGLMKYNKEGTFWNYSTSFGLALVFLTVFLIEMHYKGREKWIKRAKKCIEKPSRITEYNFTDEMITVKDPESYGEFKWSVFSTFQFYKNYLLISIKDSSDGFIVLDRNKIGKDIFNALIALLQEKITEKTG